MMTSSNGNIFRVTGPLCGDFTGQRWISLTKASDAQLWCFLLSTPEWKHDLTIVRLVIWDAICSVFFGTTEITHNEIYAGGVKLINTYALNACKMYLKNNTIHILLTTLCLNAIHSIKLDREWYFIYKWFIQSYEWCHISPSPSC